MMKVRLSALWQRTVNCWDVDVWGSEALALEESSEIPDSSERLRFDDAG